MRRAQTSRLLLNSTKFINTVFYCYDAVTTDDKAEDFETGGLNFGYSHSSSCEGYPKQGFHDFSGCLSDYTCWGFDSVKCRGGTRADGSCLGCTRQYGLTRRKRKTARAKLCEHLPLENRGDSQSWLSFPDRQVSEHNAEGISRFCQRAHAQVKREIQRWHATHQPRKRNQPHSTVPDKAFGCAVENNEKGNRA
jgi:hypothetical protein